MRVVPLLLFISAAFAQSWQPNVTNAKFESRAYSGDLRAQIQASAATTWFGYAVKSVRNNNDDGCWNSPDGRWLEDEKKGGWPAAKPSRPVALEGTDAIAILFRVDNNRVEKIRVFPISCPVDAGGLPFVWLTAVPAHASLAYLQTFATQSTDQIADAAIFAIAQHDGPEADSTLEQLTRPTQPERTREKSTFWLGASRGARGLAILKQILQTDPSDHVRDKAVFALSISKQPEGLDFLIHAANSDPSAHVRGQALFWLAQKAGKRASDAITNAIENDPDTEVKKKAVFALSQLPKDDGVPKLIEVARTQRNPEVRKQAFFWLGQSQDPRALAFIEQVLTK
ncbi:MAG: HEAT repeat domain-containing protein [Acidobacteriaceae bacterium]|nr:HEAT repeat domain-containing protein [Acidobacteriaceae bacterium]